MTEPIEVHYFYRTRWGSHDEFVELFRKNHWPILREQWAHFLPSTLKRGR